ncbi:MAG: GTPase ObgE [Acholeplasmataceae bacterium]|nr:GTPase ObgE [Acholeplasmataceae bacterium]MDD4204090.1 GTPase ObgE [Acholeplasmataceae bacterium]MDD4468702.1 GTPase ObgE [Acholeplasmataceae bacterium]MDD4824307.1 GTPase ObgE [Acholeplasmataceae bacterium]MDY0316657.1 GTPase ObgE [Acholeplasmatales bacterium]
MFKDSVDVYLKAGKGGNGIVAYRREKYVEFGGPAGGDGGKGGSIIFVADGALNTLLDFTFKKHIMAPNGQNGMPKNMLGKNGEDIILRVPVGTQVLDYDTKQLIYDFAVEGQKEIIAKGGKGGRGNTSFKTHRNPAPSISENGDLGESFHFQLELKVLADVGLVGLPNAGKSTLISNVSNAKPEIANYPFTTLRPHLGLVYVDLEKSFVMADLPGLIEGASSGIGLGFQFLKHIERCRVILHVVSMDKLENPDPYNNFLKINKELELYDETLMNRPMIVCASKMDVIGADEQFEIFKTQLNEAYPIYPISALTQTGLNTLKYKLFETLETIPKVETELIHRTYNLKDAGDFFIITQAEDGVYEVTGEGILTLFTRTNFDNEESVKRFSRQLRSYGLEDALKEKGVKPKDEVRIFGYLFELVD